ncbi:MAG: hypothetical protein ACUVQ8_05025 [Nitrososphaeria archaeon]
MKSAYESRTSHPSGVGGCQEDVLDEIRKSIKRSFRRILGLLSTLDDRQSEQDDLTVLIGTGPNVIERDCKISCCTDLVQQMLERRWVTATSM